MGLLLGIDLGTSYFKVGLFDANGALKGLGRVAVDKTIPAPGRSELGVTEFWSTLQRGLAAALTEANVSADEIAGISYSSQATTFVLLDEKDDPLTPLILWTDTRGEPVEPGLAGFSETDAFRRTIGFGGWSSQSAVPKVRWFQRTEPALWRRTHRVMTLSDYLTFALTGERAGDASTAAFLGLYDLHKDGWWPDALRVAQMDGAQLSRALQPGQPCGRTVVRAEGLLGVPKNIPFAVGALDHHAAAIGSGLGRLADLSISTGTVLAALAIVDSPTPQECCFHGRHIDGTRYWRLAFDPNGAGQLEDYQRRFAPGTSIEDLLSLAASAAPGALWAPYSGDRGVAVRAILERVAVSHGNLVRAVTAGGAAPGRIVATGGGARSPLWLQIDADILDVPIVTPACPERACLGAAIFASVAAGTHATLPEAAAAMVHPDCTYRPEPRNVALYRELLASRAVV